MLKLLMVIAVVGLTGCAQIQAGMERDQNSGPVQGQIYQDGRFYTWHAENQAKFNFASGWCSNRRMYPDSVACLIGAGLVVTPDGGNRDVTVRNR